MAHSRISVQKYEERQALICFLQIIKVDFLQQNTQKNIFRSLFDRYFIF